jgi:hypothetical protein
MVYAKKSLLLLFCVVVLASVGYLWVPDHYWIDWDTLMYMVSVKHNGAGDGSFSFMHNLLKSLMFNFYTITQHFSDNISIHQSNRILTWFFSSISSVCIFFSINHLTNKVIWSLTGALFWFMVPGNLTLIHLLEDNVWASAFLSFFILASIKTFRIAIGSGGGVTAPSWGWLLLAASSLATGINVHQQLCLLFFLFIAMVIVAPRINFQNKVLAIVLFTLSYLVLSAVQNYIAFGQFELYNSAKRLYHNPYTNVFPELWFFSSSLSLSEWFGLILGGWKRLLFFSETDSLAIYYYFLVLFVCAIIPVLNNVKFELSRKMYFATADYIWLMISFLIFIPYSLLFEPQNIERWDSVLPGAVISVFSFGFIAHSYFSNKLGKFTFKAFKLNFLTTIFLLFFIFSFYQSISYISRIRANYDNDFSAISVHNILDFLEQRDDLKNIVLILDERMRNWDMQSLITVYYPSCSFIVVNDKSLLPVYSSRELLTGEKYPEKPLNLLNFNDSDILGIMPTLYEKLQSTDPDFLNRKTICLNGVFECNAKYIYSQSDQIVVSWFPGNMKELILPVNDVRLQSHAEWFSVVSTGNDPSVVLKDIVASPENDLVMKLKMDSPEITTCKIYYKTKAEVFYTERKTVSVPVQIGENNLYFKLPKNMLQGDVRLDPGNLPGEYKIYSIKIKSIID